MPPSVTRPVSLAIERSKRICFQPFVAGKWFALGFCAFLASLGHGGGGGLNFSGRTKPPFGRGTSAAAQWVTDNPGLLCAIAFAVLVVGLGLSLLLTWLHCRGTFMFLDGVARNRGAVVEPWHALRAAANSLLRFYIALLLASLAFIATAGGACLAIAWPDLRADRFDDAAVTALVLGVILFVPFGIAMAIIQFLVRNFVVPAMYLRGEDFRASWNAVSREVLAGRGGLIVRYVLMKIVLTLGIGVIAVAAMLLTCCLAALPYLGTVILLPLYVFSQCYPLYFLEQFGPSWRCFADDPAGPYCRTCGYNLRGNVSGTCPECGTPVYVPVYPAPPAPPTAPY